jgi:hypothetical protein
MKNYSLFINEIYQKNFYETWEEAEQVAKDILDNTHFRFVSAFHNGKLLTIFIKKGYDLYSFKTFKYLDEIGKISDYFIIHQDGIDNYYIKTKK